MNPFLLSSLIGAGAGIFGQQQQNDSAVRATELANAAARQAATVAHKRNKQAATLGFRRDVRTMERANDMNQVNTKQAQAFNSKEAAIARTAQRNMTFQAREWQNQDYRRTKEDQSNQFVALREAAEKAGFNPLSVMGAGGFVPPSAPGLGSSSFGAASSPGAPPVAGFGSSVPMSYGAPVSVAPLASNEAVVGAVAELGRELTGVNEIERANEQFYRDLAAIESERASQRMPAPVVYAPTPGVAGLGRTAVPVGDERGNPYALGYELESPRSVPLSYHGTLPNGQDYELLGQPGDGLDELLGTGVQIGAQESWRRRSDVPGRAWDVINPVGNIPELVEGFITNLPRIFPPDVGGYVPGGHSLSYPPVGQQPYTMESF